MNGTHRWLGRTVAAAGIGAASTALVSMAASRRWQQATDRLIADLERSAREPGHPVSFSELAALPSPVARYFRLVLREGQPRIRGARMRQTGTFRSREGGDPETGWAPFTATQRFTAEPPGFVWDARIRVAPVVSVRVRDGYVAGSASMRGAIASIVSVVNAPDDDALRAGALQRFLAEAVWLPTVLLPGAGVEWKPLDETHARASLTDGSITVALDVEFGPTGVIAGMRTPERMRAVPGQPGRYVPTPWGGRYARYEEHAGMLVPTEAEVYWVLDGREAPYYRGCNVRLEYDLGASSGGRRGRDEHGGAEESPTPQSLQPVVGRLER